MGSGTDVARESADIVFDWQRSIEARRDPADGAALPSYHHAELCRYSCGRQHRCWSGGIRLFKSTAGCLHSRFIRDGFHLEFRQIASTSHIGQSILFAGFFHNRTLQPMMGKMCWSREPRYMDQVCLDDKPPRTCSRECLPRLLLRKHREWQARRSG